MTKKTAIIIGAGPAGLTAALELLEKTSIKPIIFEMSEDIGGISKTVHFKGNRIDIGGHRFFSKSERVMQWWQNILPIQGAPAKDDLLLGRKVPLSLEDNAPDPQKENKVMLFRSRLSRIFFLRKFFDYPITLTIKTVKNLGILRTGKIGLSYVYASLFPIKNEKSLEDFFINRFGRELYKTFFKDYTEKVWGVPCVDIKPEWGAQRIKGLSITKAILHAARNLVSSDSSINQKEVETTLIGQFLYPKFGPGQLWEEVAKKVVEKGGEIYFNHKATRCQINEKNITSIEFITDAGAAVKKSGDYFFSTMPVKDLILSMQNDAPQDAQHVANGLIYRDFITVGVLLKKLLIQNQTETKTINNLIPDNWIYIQENDVKLGRLQIFNNWSPYLVKDQDTAWIGMEYFCNEGDSLWEMPDDELANFAIKELAEIGICDTGDVLDTIIIRVPKTYPAYFGSYDQFHLIREFTDQIENLFLVGRNGMHRYNNMDHSMLTAMTAVENIINNVTSKDNIWEVNSEEEYHEEKNS